METLDPVENDVVEGRIADLATAAAPAVVGEAAVCGRMAPSSFRSRRQVDPGRRAEPPDLACFELSASRLVYASTSYTPLHTPTISRQGCRTNFRVLQEKQREAIWQLKSVVSP